jgi:threonine dehydratase
LSRFSGFILLLLAAANSAYQAVSLGEKSGSNVMVEPVRPIALEDIEEARERIAGAVLRTPLVRLDLGPGGPDIRLKLENLQPTNAYKIRGAVNAVGKLKGEERARGVWTVSAGNAGQGVAYAARAAGIDCTVVAIESAPRTKLDRMAALGTRIVPVPYEVAWKAVTDHEFEGMDGLFIHPFDNHDFIAGHGTMGLEILEDAPDARAVIAAIGGGGLITGVGSAIKALRPDIRVYGAEPETAAPYAFSLREGGPRPFPDWKASFVDGAGGQSVTDRMWERMRAVVDGAITVSLDQTREAMRLLAEKARVIAEGAGALSPAAALTGEAGVGPIVCVISGGNIDLAKFASLVTAGSE